MLFGTIYWTLIIGPGERSTTLPIIEPSNTGLS